MSEKSGRRNYIKLFIIFLLGGIFGIIIKLRLFKSRLHAMNIFKPHNNADYVWQLDPGKCIQCETCSDSCVLKPSAVKCAHLFASCGYCDLCSGFFREQRLKLDTGAENQLCPTDAIKRTYIEEPFFEYRIDEEKCMGCGRCVKGCASFGNGSLILQVRHDRCLNCNECTAAVKCPAKAYRKVPSNKPYIIDYNPE